jgi:resuscitation-promoting factor RpfB
MRSTRVGVYVFRGILLPAAILFTILFTTFLIQNVFAQGEGADVSVPASTPAPSHTLSADITTDDGRISLFSPKHITITFVNENYSGLTYAPTVKEALLDFDLDLNSKHVTKPDLDFVLTEDTHIRILEVVREQYTETESIPFESVSVNDPTMEIYTTSVTQVGRNGTKEITYENTFINGILSSTRKLDEILTVKPQEEIVAVGTKVVPTEDVSACQEMGPTYWTEYIQTMNATDEEKDWLLCISACESGRNNCRVSYNYRYYGLMQYDPSVFSNASGGSIWDGGEQLRLALAVYRYGNPYGAFRDCHTSCSQ